MGAAALALGAAGVGCGDSDSAADRGGRAATSSEQSRTATTATQPKQRRNDPPRPLYPSCGLEAFGPPSVSVGTGGRGWRVAYQHPRPEQARQVGATSQVQIEERPADSGRVRYATARTLRVGGRRVDLTRPRGGRGSGLSIAQWVTKRARYVAFIDGKTTVTLRKIVACSP